MDCIVNYSEVCLKNDTESCTEVCTENDTGVCSEVCTENCFEYCTEIATGYCTEVEIGIEGDTENCCTEGKESIVYDSFLDRDLFIFGLFLF